MKNKILEVLQIFNAAITNMRLYPPTSAMVVNTIERLFQAIDAVLASGTAIVIAEVEKHLLVGEEPLTIKEMERPQVAAFLELLINFGIQSITIIPGLERKELLSFIEVMVQKPEVVKDAGGFTQVMADRKISHIILDQKVYIAKDGDNKLFAGLEIRDDDEFINYLIQADPRLDISMDNLRQMAKNTTWLERIFRNGMSQIMAKKGQLPNSHLMGNLMRMIGTLDGMTDKKDQDYISRLIAESITELDAEMIGIVLSQDMDRYFNGKIVEHVHDQVDEEKLERVMEHLGRITAGPSLPGGVTDSLYSGAERAYKRLREAYQGRKLSKRKGIEATETAEEREIRLQSLKETLETLLVGDGEALLDGQFMDTISKWTEPLLDSKQYEKLETLIERLVKALEHPNQRVRNQAATALAWIIDHLPQDRQAETLEKLVNPLVVWIKRETAATAAYRFFCFRLRDQIVKYLKEKKYEACLPLIDVFHLIDYGRLEKNDTIQEIAAEVINSLATTERLDVLFELYSKSEEKEKKDLGRLLARMGEGSLRRLMDLLRDHPNSDERVKILHLIVDIGPSAISVIKETSREDAPWYYHRNLAYLLGFIKSPKTLEVLQTLLNHQHHKVRHEALKSLYRIGDEDRGPVLLSILPNVDDSFKIAIVEMLGKLKYQNAVPVLAEMLKNRPFLVTAGRMELEEHICTALGKIGSPAAVPILTEISKPKFFSVSSYPEKVKIAATKALREINLK